MAEIKHETPGVTKYADHEVIVPPNRLKKAIRRAGVDDYDPLTAAEGAFEELSAQFGTWMQDECAELDEARRRVHIDGLTAVTRQLLFRTAHDIKGHGPTFGFPIAADVADSLCRVIENDATRLPLSFIDQCVDAVRAIIREHGRPNADAVAAELAGSLRALADDLLGVRKDTDAPGSPPLAPV
jgi:hypothetical protein